METLETVRVKPNELGKTIKIRYKLENELNTRLQEFLLQYSNVFAWSHADVPMIDPSVAYHSLAVSKETEPVKQKKRFFNKERYDTISVNVDKFL